MGKAKGRHFQARLTPLTIKHLVSKGEPGLYADGGNLYLQIGRTGAASWIFDYMMAGRRRRKGLGPLRLVPVDVARQHARELALMVYHGTDPLNVVPTVLPAEPGAPRERSKVPTFKECALDYLESHKDNWTPKSATAWGSTFRTYAYPVIGNLPVDQVTRDHVETILRPIWTVKTATAKLLRGRIAKVLGAAKDKRHRPQGDENPAIWKDGLEHRFPAPGKIRKTKPRPALPYKQIGQFMSELRQEPSESARILEFQILTALRPGPARLMRFQEIDLENRLWRIPGQKMKSRVRHEVPLSDQAIQLLRRQGAGTPGMAGAAYVFKGRKPGLPLSDATVSALIERMNDPVVKWVDPKLENIPIVPHGFRSSFSDWAAEVERVHTAVTEVCLAHAIENQVEAAYRRGDLIERRIEVMNAWADYCDSK